MAESAPAEQRSHGILLRKAAENVLDRHCYTSRRQQRIAIVTWIEETYRRRQS